MLAVVTGASKEIGSTNTVGFAIASTLMVLSARGVRVEHFSYPTRTRTR